METNTQSPRGQRTTHLNENSTSRLNSANCPQYQVHRTLGKGGEGVVYEVRDRFLKRPMALKVSRKSKGNPVARRRFLREIMVTAHLEHPNITPVYEGGYLEDGAPYLVMKKISGGTFKAKLEAVQEDSSHDLTKLLEIFLKICDAIEYAHSRGIIHRDLKPSNIAVGRFGEVVVMDWGLAKFLGQADDPVEALSGNELSQLADEDISLVGSMLGTPGYMAPEQANGEEVGPWSDVYSLGAVLYEILAHRPPYTGTQQEILSTLLLQDPAPPSQVAPKRPIPRPLEAIAMHALEREGQDRYPTVSDLARDVHHYLQGKSISVYTPPLPERMAKFAQRHSGKLVVAMILATVLALFGYLLALEKERKLAAEQEQNRLAREKLDAEKKKVEAEQSQRQTQKKMLEAERKENLAQKKQQETLKRYLAAQQKREEELKKTTEAYRPYLVARNLLYQSPTFQTIKKVIIPKFEESLRIQPKFLLARTELVKAYFLMNRSDKAMTEMVKLSSQLPPAERQKFLQMFFNLKTRFKEIKKEGNFEISDDLRPASMPKLYWLTMKIILYENLNLHQQAYQSLREVLQLKEALGWEVLYMDALVSYKLKKRKEAKEKLFALLETYPHLSHARILLAGIYIDKKKNKMARRQMEIILNRDRTNHMAWSFLAKHENHLANLNHNRNPSPRQYDLFLAHTLATLRFARHSLTLEPGYEHGKIYLKNAREKLTRLLRLPSEYKHWEAKAFVAAYKRIKQTKSRLLKKEFALLVYRFSQKPPLADWKKKIQNLRPLARKLLREYLKNFSRPIDLFLLQKAIKNLK